MGVGAPVNLSVVSSVMWVWGARVGDAVAGVFTRLPCLGHLGDSRAQI